MHQRLEAAARRARAALADLISDSSDPGTEALGAQHELEQALVSYVLTPRDPEAAGLPRLFHLQRDIDISGVSGTGRVADGVLWPDDTVSIRWRGDRPSTVSWDHLADAEAIHGHGGATRIVWADGAQPAAGAPQPKEA